MATLKEKNQLASLACKALKEYYGFAPSKNQIVLLEGKIKYDEIEMVHFRIVGRVQREYRVTLSQLEKSNIIVDDVPYRLNIYGGY